jgi:hypothetical protein
MNVLRDRNALYRELVSGRIENVYTLKILNKSDRNHPLTLIVTGSPNLSVETEPTRPEALAGEMTIVTARVQASPTDGIVGGNDIVFEVRSEIAPEISADARSRFFMPAN